MPKTRTVSVRLDPELKQEVEDIFARLGLSITQAIALFYTQVQLHGGLPFDLRIPNHETRRALADAEARRELTRQASTSDLFADLGI